MVLGWPQGIYLALTAVGLGVTIAKHGEPKGNYSVGTALVSLAITLPLLWWGGFFSH